MAAGHGLIGRLGIPRQLVPVTPANDDTSKVNGVGIRLTTGGVLVFVDGSDTARSLTMPHLSELQVQVKQVLASATIGGSTVTSTVGGVHVYVLHDE